MKKMLKEFLYDALSYVVTAIKAFIVKWVIILLVVISFLYGVKYSYDTYKEDIKTFYNTKIVKEIK